MAGSCAGLRAPLVLCLVLLAGGCPAASNFLLLRQKKVTKEKATRSLGPYASLRATCGARLRRGLAQTRFAQTSAIPDPPTSALLGPARTGQAGAGTEDRKQKHQEDKYKQGLAKASPCFFRYSVFGFPLPAPTPCGCAEERRARRIRAKTCLSRRRVVFDPGWTEHRRLPVAKRRDAATRVAFSFAYFSFGEAKEK